MPQTADATPLALDRTFTFGDQSVAWGTVGSGPPIVFVHGTPFSAQVWRRIVPWVTADRSAWFFDLLG